MNALEATAANLAASIAARKAAPDEAQTPDFKAVTAAEEARLAEVKAAISKPTPTKP
jgi:hypothetical protein